MSVLGTGSRGREIVSVLRRELEGLNKEILGHPYVRDAERGSLPREKILRFVSNQLYIIPHDMRSLSHVLSRASLPDEIEFFKTALEGDYQALRELYRLAGELGVSPGTHEVDPRAVAYTHYLAWLSLYGTLGEVAVALVVNLPVWGELVGRLGRALRERYGLRETGLFELFSRDYTDFEKSSYTIIERYETASNYRRVSRLIQSYEKMFWDAIYE